MSMNMEHIDAYIRTKFNLPDDWGWSEIYSVLNKDMVLLTGTRCHLVTRGKNKGKPNLRRPLEKISKMDYDKVVVDLNDYQRWAEVSSVFLNDLPVASRKQS